MGLFDAFNKLADDLKVARDAQRPASAAEPMPAEVTLRNYVSASHILVATLEEASELKARLDAGEVSFEQAARQLSLCKSKANGGALGVFKSLARILFLPYESKWTAVQAFDAYVFSPDSPLGEVSIVQTDFGTHLVRLDARDVKP